MENWKEVIGALFGVLIGVVWLGYVLIGPGDIMFLFVAIALTMVFGTISGGLYSISAQSKNQAKN